MPTLTLREYHPETGALLGNVSSMAFGRIQSGTHSRVKVADIAFSGASSVGNIKLGVIASSGVTVNSDPLNKDANNTTSNGRLGIEDSAQFSSSKASSPLTRHFSGVNGTGNSSSENNALIGSKSALISNYIYLDLELGATDTSAINGAYRVFFDYS
tara:strand:- start:18495 stop:18965 length:471 start_codon:yes stop_codon:yes gene_type:complete